LTSTIILETPESRHLSGLANLRFLDLSATKITDAGLAKLTPLDKLRRLSLMETDVTAAGVAQLRGMKGMNGLNAEGICLNYTDISDEDVLRLQRSGVPVSKFSGSVRSRKKQ